MDVPNYTGLVPMIPVSDVSATIAFYEQIGFKVGNSVSADGSDKPNWAWLYNGDAHVMINQAPEQIEATHASASLWVYTADVVAAHAFLKERGLDVGEISHPFYNPRGEFHVHDPDGYAVFIAHADNS
jgi:catechol 2,3-dioxygenase-like lactoylglutathione lyase family enzyme